MKSTATSADAASLRWLCYGVLIVLSTGAMAGRTLSVTARHGRTPFQSANDRSRIATVRSLVERGTYAIDDVIYQTRNGDVLRDAAGEPIRQRDWHTIDMVRHTDAQGVLRSYSSKPTLLPTLLAGPYWLIRAATGESLATGPFYVGRLLLLLTNVLPLAGYFVIVAWLAERWGRTDWGKIYTVAAATFGTFLPTFAVTINNHLPAAIAAAIAIFAAAKIWYDDDRRWYWFALCGLAAAFTAANELPALSFCVFLGAALGWKYLRPTAAAFLPAALAVAAAALLTNYIAHGDWRTPYAHRQLGSQIGSLPLATAGELDARRIPAELRQLAAKQPKAGEVTPAAFIEIDKPGQQWVFSDRAEALRLAIVRHDDGLHVHAWDNWYRFAGAYWFSGKETKIDRGEPSALNYAFQCTLGHHGIFSLTPLWLAALAGTAMLLVRRSEQTPWELAVLTAVTTIVVLAFYLTRGQVDRTYGGFACGLRWMFWFAPLWLVMLLPAADWLGKTRWGQAAALALLLVSALSAFYGSANPWTHPWLYDYWAYIGWIKP